MGEKRETIEEVARREADSERALAAAQSERLELSGQVAKEMPERFFELCGLLRENVRRFNSAADPQKRLMWRESVALAARDPNLNGDFNCTFGRVGGELTVALNAMGRSGKPDVYIIEGAGQLGVGEKMQRFMLRIEGFAKDRKVQLRITVDFKRLDCTLEELSERLVLTVLKSDFNQLYRVA
jgi:hypothetical protein